MSTPISFDPPPGRTPPPPPPPTGPTGQTIVIDRRDRLGCLRWWLLPAFLLSLLVNCSMIGSMSGAMPRRLSESYVAGDLSLGSIDRKIAIVEISGAIADRTTDYAIRQLKQARDDHSIKAVVLRIDSPGGTVTGSDRIWREVELVVKGTDKKGTSKKPLVVSMGGMAASGGYYVAAPADMIFAEPTTLTGSIGVIMEVPQVHELLGKVGVNFETITTGEFKDMGSMFRPMTDKERARWHEMIDSSYQRFVRVVADGRKLKLDEAKTIANGKVYTTAEALELKLIDQIGYLDDAIEEAQRRANLSDVKVIRYSRPAGLESLLLEGASDSSSVPNLGLGMKLDRETIMELSVPQMLYLAR